MAAKRPAFQFYPADWRKDTELQSCSIAARGLWHELLCIMHESTPYGHLTVNAHAMTDEKAARACGVELREYRKLLGELEDAGVPSRTDEGVMYSRRMVRDEHIRNVRAEAGSKGGNPALLGPKHKPEGSPEVKQTFKQVPTPSSSSSSSPSTSVGVGVMREGGPEGEDARPELELNGHDHTPPSASPPDEKPLNGKDKHRGSRIPDDWRPSDELIEWAGKVYSMERAAVIRKSLTFVDHWSSVSGRFGVKLDWEKTFRNWIRKDMGDA